MSEDDFSPAGSNGQASADEADPAELSRLSSLHEDLVEAVHSAVNPTVRDDLLAELQSVRERVAELTGSDPSARSIPGLDDVEGQGLGAFSGVRVDQATQALHSPSDGVTDVWNGGAASSTGDSASNPVGGALVPVAVPGYDPNLAGSGALSSLLKTPLVPVGLAIVGVLFLGGLFVFSGDDEEGTEVASVVSGDADEVAPAGATTAGAAVVAARSAFAEMGLDSVQVTSTGGVLVITGEVASEAERDQVLAATAAVAPGLTIDSLGLAVTEQSGNEQAPSSEQGGSPLQRELNRLLGSTPITFAVGEVELTELHRRILNNVVSALLASPNQQVIVVGYTDQSGTPEANESLARSRAQNVANYLVAQGVDVEQLTVDAAGERDASGASSLAPLERRVEFTVAGTAGTAGDAESAAATVATRVAVLTQSARNDLASGQSMVDALTALESKGAVSLAVSESVIPADVEARMAELAAEGHDLIVAHSYQYGPMVAKVARQFPDVVFAWGPASETFGLPNVYSYDAKAEQGGYVLGTIAALLSQSGKLGFIGPLEIGDADAYATGFQAGALAQRPGTAVSVEYTGSFSDFGVAADVARKQVEAGVDVMTGSSPMAIGAVEVAAQQGVLWVGNQADQSSLAPELVVASQVYDWEIALSQIISEMTKAPVNGRVIVLDLVNGGLTVAFNSSYALPQPVRARADEVLNAVVSGVIVPPS